MPISANPDATFDIVLESDKKLPKAKQPRFIYRFLTCKQWAKIANYRDTIEDSVGANEALDKTFQAVSTNLVDWQNMKNPATGKNLKFNVKKLPEILTIAEAQELVAKLMIPQTAFDVKKKLDSPSPSNTERPAKTARE